ncbi:MAG: beta-N-acetylhexosaminidase [Rhodanobacteraceae bacterium]
MLIVGIPDKALGEHERRWLAEPQVSGVILFARNFEDRAQIMALIDSIRDLRPGPFLVCVDQEGGPVQRLRKGFTSLPALSTLGRLHDRDAARAVAMAEEHAWLMASEMRAIDIDLSFAPVVDLARGNRAIDERALHADPAVVSELALAYLRGMHLGGMAATLKHFPGHGSVVEDTHFEIAHDPRSLDEIRRTDLVPFADAIGAGAEAVMLAHVIYPAVDSQPAGCSAIWIRQLLRGEFGFAGTVISDDIGMAAARPLGNVTERVALHLAAGCDLILACDPAIVPEALATTSGATPCEPERLARLRGNAAQSWDALVDNPQRDHFIARVMTLDQLAQAG